jgi:hypothetical protein
MFPRCLVLLVAIACSSEPAVKKPTLARVPEPASQENDEPSSAPSVSEPSRGHGEKAEGFVGRKPPPPSQDEGKPGYHTILSQLRPCLARNARVLQRLGKFIVRVQLGVRPEDTPNVQVLAPNETGNPISSVRAFNECALAGVSGIAHSLPAGESYSFDLQVSFN